MEKIFTRQILADNSVVKRTLFIFFNTALFFSITLAAVFGIFAFDYFRSHGPLRTETRLVIKPGSGLNQISETLARQGIIEYPTLFSLIIRTTNSGYHLKAGEYLFTAGSSPFEVFSKIAAGDIHTHMLTIPEGLMTFQILELIDSAPYLVGKTPKNIAEGTLLPETYSYHYGDTRESVVARMQSAMKKTLTSLWENRDLDLPIQNINEALILASIVEKETGIASERGRVAAVFINRLKKRMRLQSDPTTIYSLTNGESVFNRKLYRKDLATKSPYNTYAVFGLPPGPIANPGKSAIEAVLSPPSTNELYFVADGTGGHKFAKSLKEHNRNVQHWRNFQKNKSKKMEK